MSVELIAVVVSAVGIVLTLGTTMLAGFARLEGPERRFYTTAR